MTRRASTPAELWVFIVGYVVYAGAGFAGLLGGLDFANPISMFPAATAYACIETRERRAYRGTLVLVAASILYPLLFPLLAPGTRGLGSGEAWWVLAPQISLLALLLSPRVRRFVRRPSRLDEVVDTRCA